MPTPEQLKAYADKLPQIYRDMLMAFGEAMPDRKFGESVAAEAVYRWTRNVGPQYQEDDVALALHNLENANFLTWLDIGPPDAVTGHKRGRYAPTELGEGLLEAVTGVQRRKVPVPALPAPTW